MNKLRVTFLRLATALTLVVGLMLIPFTGVALAASQAPNSVSLGTLPNRADAASKDMKGKLESAYGEATGDTGHQLKGKMKQIQGSAMDAAEDLKEGAKSTAKKIGDAAKELADDIT